MPWRTDWVDPEVFLRHKGVTVYHSYKDNTASQPLRYWYTTNPEYSETSFSGKSDPYEFDVRMLQFPVAEGGRQVVEALTPPFANETEQIADKIRRAIDAGMLRIPPPEI